MKKEKIYKEKKYSNNNMSPSDPTGSLDEFLSKDRESIEKTLVFLDSGFLSKLNKHFSAGDYISYDIIKFSKRLAKKQNFFCKHIFYYTCPPFQSAVPTKDEIKRKKGYDKFIVALSKNKDITIREGRIQKIINEDGGTQYKQKGVDTLLTIDLSHLREDFPKIRKIILVSSDTDFCPVIKDIKKRWGMEVILCSYFDRRRNSKFSISNELIKLVDKYILLIKQDFENCKLKRKNE